MITLWLFAISHFATHFSMSASTAISTGLHHHCATCIYHHFVAGLYQHCMRRPISPFYGIPVSKLPSTILLSLYGYFGRPNCIISSQTCAECNGPAWQERWKNLIISVITYDVTLKNPNKYYKPT